MQSQLSLVHLFVAFSVATISGFAPFVSTQIATAHPLSFLISPYYGTKSIYAFFDHDAPFAYDGYFLKYTGARNLSNCTVADTCYDGHEGTDFSLVYERVLAAASGKVMIAAWADPTLSLPACHAGNRSGCGLGLYIEILHDNGYSTKYGHLSSLAVSEGQYVSAGQVIGMSGNTGNSSGAHLHFDVLNSGGKWVDPFGWRGGGSDPSGSSTWGGYSYCMWADGQWANECGGVSNPLTVPSEFSTTILDDQGTGFTKGCTAGSPCPYPFWYDDSSAGYSSHLFFTSVKSGSDGWAKWQPTLSVGGAYEIWAYVSPVSVSYTKTTWAAIYTIQHAYGQSVAVADQVSTANRWLSLGLYRFNSGSTGYVRLTDYTGETDYTRKVRADAIKFVNVNIPAARAQTKYDDPHYQFIYSGTWTRYPNVPGYFADTTSLSSENGAYVDFVFQGSQVTWITTKDLNRGLVTVTIDGYNKGTFDLYSPNLQNQYRLTFFNLGPGTHTLRIARSYASPTGFYAEMDAISTQRYDQYIPFIKK